MINEKQKPWAITKEELDLRFEYGEGRMTRVEFDRRFKRLKKQGKIRRDGRVVR
jgi:hypothetical protein